MLFFLKDEGSRGLYVLFFKAKVSLSESHNVVSDKLKKSKGLQVLFFLKDEKVLGAECVIFLVFYLTSVKNLVGSKCYFF